MLLRLLPTMLRFPKLPLPAARRTAAACPAAQAARTILVFGDSLSAGYGIRQDASWPALLARRLQEKKLDYSVVNASISGETSAGGRTRIAAALRTGTRHRWSSSPSAPTTACVACRWRSCATTSAPSSPAPRRSKAQVLLVGQRIPPNYGAYALQFHQVFGAVAKARKAALVDFLLAGVATTPQLFQADNLHPTAAAQPLLLDNVWQGLAPLLK
jgi:acyl-CoA thioesterase-1